MSRTALAAALFALCVDAHASVITADQIVANASPDVTFSVMSPHPSATLQLKSQGGETGVGVSGSFTDGEIDIDEVIVAVFTQPVTIDSLRLMLLFPPPAYDDTEEKAQVSAWGPSTPDSEPVVLSLTAGYGLMASYDGPGTVEIPSEADVMEGGAALWTWSLPFGSMVVSRLEFTAVSNLDGFCWEGSCTNDSDYSIESIEYTMAPSEVPEPTTVGLIGAGLVGIWSTRRRRRSPSPRSSGRSFEM